MGLTFGDVLAFVAGILATGATLWAAILVSTLLFRERAMRAEIALAERPLKTLFLGAGIAGTAGIGGIILLNLPHGLLKLMGWVVLLVLLSLATLGSGGLALRVSDGIRGMDEKLPTWATACRAAALLVAAGMLPVLGWFLLFPAMMLASLGAGWQAVMVKQRETAAAAAAAAVPEPSATPPANANPLP